MFIGHEIWQICKAVRTAFGHHCYSASNLILPPRLMIVPARVVIYSPSFGLYVLLQLN